MFGCGKPEVAWRLVRCTWEANEVDLKASERTTSPSRFFHGPSALYLGLGLENHTIVLTMDLEALGLEVYLKEWLGIVHNAKKGRNVVMVMQLFV